jgi:hypothetical protein
MSETDALQTPKGGGMSQPARAESAMRAVTPLAATKADPDAFKADLSKDSRSMWSDMSEMRTRTFVAGVVLASTTLQFGFFHPVHRTVMNQG